MLLFLKQVLKKYLIHLTSSQEIHFDVLIFQYNFSHSFNVFFFSSNEMFSFHLSNNWKFNPRHLHKQTTCQWTVFRYVKCLKRLVHFMQRCIHIVTSANTLSFLLNWPCIPISTLMLPTRHPDWKFGNLASYEHFFLRKPLNYAKMLMRFKLNDGFCCQWKAPYFSTRSQFWRKVIF